MKRFVWLSSVGWLVCACVGVVAAVGQGLPSCEWCGAREAPADLIWTMHIPPADEPGEPLTITGTVYQADGTTPAADVLLYAYHTNAEGVYPKRGDETGNAQRHGYLRGWLRTDAEGRYRITTIRPVSYPSRSEPAHIHLTVTPPGGEEDWIDVIVFADDRLVTRRYRASRDRKGGSGIVTLEHDAESGWHGVRDIVLPR